MLTATIEARGINEALDLVLKEAAGQALAIAAEQIRARLAQRFDTEGRMFGPAWIQRKPRSEKLPHRPILFSSGRLRASFIDPHHREHIEVIEESGEAGRPTLLLGSAVPYASFHHWGTSHGLPARPILTAEILSA